VLIGLILSSAAFGQSSVLTDDEKTLLTDRPMLRNVLESGRDVWGEAAMKQADGPSYEFFAGLIPPLRYVNAGFRQYPIVLSAPEALIKARIISNGSAVNALGNHGAWKEIGCPVTFKVGSNEVYGSDLRRLDGPHYDRGYLPVVQLAYKSGGAVYSEEAFGSVDKLLAECGTVFVRFALKEGSAGTVAAEVGSGGAVEARNGVLRDSGGNALVSFDKAWKWDEARKALVASLDKSGTAELVIFAKSPAAAGSLAESYDKQRAECARVWNALLGRAMVVETPETVVNNAWRSLIIGTYMLVKDDLMCYSNGNQYEKIYVNEGLDAIHSLLLWGYKDDSRRMILPIMDFKREGLLYHQAGLKLQMLSNYYWLTHDDAFIKEQRERWMVQVNRVIDGREKTSGLFPKEQYCGDIAQPVYSLNSNSNSWRGIRDFGAVLDEIGDKEQAKRCEDTAKEFRPVIIDAVNKSIRTDVKPPFIPMALFGEEKPYEAITATRLGGYYDLMFPLVLGSEVLGVDSELTGDMLDYVQQHGGICMGMVRVHPGGQMYQVKQGVDDLYTLRYVLTLLRRDEADLALVTFYGKLAQGMTRETFIDGESSGLVADDEFGRVMYLPPNSAANGLFLTMLRYLLVQDYDMNDDGKPETLRLFFATPRQWLEDGKTIRIEHAPTAFGEVSVVMRSKLNSGQVIAEVTAPSHAPERMLLRARVPRGWRVVGAKAGGKALSVKSGDVVDISKMTGKFTVSFEVTKQ